MLRGATIHTHAQQNGECFSLRQSEERGKLDETALALGVSDDFFVMGSALNIGFFKVLSEVLHTVF